MAATLLCGRRLSPGQAVWRLPPGRHPGAPGVRDQAGIGEIRRLLTTIARPQHPGEHYQRWSRWRRRDQARARISHYQRRQQLHISLRLYY